MRKYLTKKRMIVLTVIALAIGAAGGAYAYFTSTGSGTGSATVGSSSNIAITSDAPSASLYPGAPAASVAVHLHNPGSGNEYVGTVTGTVEDITSGPNAGCLGTWFTVAPITYNSEVNAGATNNTSTTISMTDASASQDACQGATLTIDWSSN